ncbi:acyl-CoA dehydrogenase family protein [Halopseudomonas maritima]|uniref:acyl-CoA dehydrogenase family protein n=1 Tax=Halopseudomonas maritima TaxID=2918528 RepID=UPI001EECB740|nr:acyl-CoA dehydrogenase family protein [Halopseudomonas maritima]UJJ31587.1 acyl-CoA/acyl-ACP dehydrogenase [Halopseudomonas maritima]
MDFSLSEDQRAIAEMADSVFRDYCTDERLREFDLDAAPYMRPLWQTCIETGLHALAIPEQAGGSGMGMTDLFCVLRAQGAGLGQVPLWQHQLAAACLARFGGADTQPLVAQAAAGQALLSLSLNGLAASHGVGLQLEQSNDCLLLNGRLSAVDLGAQADQLLVLADTDDGVQLILLDPRAEGVELIEGVYNHGQAVADLACHSVCIRADQVLPQAAIRWLEQRAIAAVASLQLGVSEEQLKRTVAYVSERVQFDRPIGSFQAVQMTVADCHVALEALRSALYQLCYRLDTGLPCDSEALATRYLCTEAAHLIGHKAQHVHGGIGVDLTYPIHRFLYWSRYLSLVLGGSAATLERLGDWLANNDTLGWKYDLDENQSLC